MKKFISSFLILSAIVLVAISFRTGSAKYGPHLQSLLDNTNQNNFIVYIYLSDKGPNALTQLSAPLNLVTQRSLDRRTKVKQANDLVDYYDIPVYDGYVSELSSKVLNVRNQLKWLNALSAEVNRSQLEQLNSLNYVTKIEMVETYKKVKDEPVDQNYAPAPVTDNTNVDTLNYGTTGGTQITQIKVNLVHNQGIYGQGVLIASLDDGFRNQTHPCFNNPANPMVIVSQYDFQLHLPGAYRTSDSHGTTTISCIGAYAPGSLIGVSFKSKFLVARTEVDSFERNIEMDNWIAASQWADSLGADVISSSLGYLGFDAGETSWTWQDMNGNTVPVTIGADIAVHHGITVFNSAGNNGDNSSHNTLGAPADGDSVITIGAVGPSGTRSSFSSVGPTTDNPPRIKPDVMAMGSGVQTASGSGTGYSGGFSSGTSYSCPIAAGVGGLILSANKNLTPLQVRGILRKFASNSNSPNNQLGWGIIDAQQSVDSARKLDNQPPVITHTQPFTSTTNTGVITMKAKITDNGIIRVWTNQAPLLYYRKSTNGGVTWSSYTALNYNYTSPDSFFFPIPGNPAGTRVEYYFAAQDIALPNPLMSTLPSGGSGINPPGTTAPPTRFVYDVVTVGISINTNEIPKSFALYSNYPNPFNPVTRIKFDIPADVKAKLVVYDILGREVSTVIDGELKAGSYSLDFDASNLPSGVYFYRLTTDRFTDTKKMLLIK